MSTNQRLGNHEEQMYHHQQNQRARFEREHPQYDSGQQRRSSSYDEYDVGVCKRNIQAAKANITLYEGDLQKHKRTPSRVW